MVKCGRKLIITFHLVRWKLIPQAMYFPIYYPKKKSRSDRLERRVPWFCTICAKNQSLIYIFNEVMAILVPGWSLFIVHPDEKLVPLVPQKIGFADACAWRRVWNDASTVALIGSTSCKKSICLQTLKVRANDRSAQRASKWAIERGSY